ncbi:MAG: GH3 auxin-responsive promoter family protein, partial [Planctomycetes bacterium]|nr:GH3 auxin-responsive promoter family protein [Planctomycetota bacterium]
EQGKRYRTIITTSGGLYRYDLGDIVEVTGMRGNTPEIAFLHKAGNVLSITGEKVTEDQVVKAMKNVEEKFPDIAGFSVTMELTSPPRYILAVEMAQGEPDKARALEMACAFDCELRSINEEYDEKRSSGRLDNPELLLLAKGSYLEYRKLLVREGKPDGQIKPPHLVKPAGEGAAPVKGCKVFDRMTVIKRFGKDGQ